MTAEVLGASFRDPSGFVFMRGPDLYRQVNQRYKRHYDLLHSSGLYEALVSEELLVPHQEVCVEPADAATVYRVLRPQRVQFVSYPYEWSFSQLKDAALLVLRVQEIALEHGMSLHDASAYNVQFVAARPVFIDTLSFESIREDQPWIAYGQFCRHFLAPLALMSYVDGRLGALLRTHMDGIPLDLADRLLPRAARYRPSIFLHLHAHARHVQRADAKRRTGGFSRRAFEGILKSLRTAVQRLQPPSQKTAWAGYYSEADHYTPEGFDDKAAIVDAAIERVQPRTVWDLGANTGVFGRLAAKRGIPTICLDADHASVENSYRRAVQEGEDDVLSLVCDLTNPSPALGWAHRERFSLVERGPADLVLVLALIHHLAIGNNVPLAEIARFLHLIGRWVLVEFIPKNDPKVELLLSTRDDIFDDYDASEFERAAGAWFEIVQVSELRGSARSVYLLRARDDLLP